MFIDEAKIWVKAGDGGKGGSVYFEARDNVDTLLDFAGKHHWRAANGGGGQGGNKAGADGEDLVIGVPPGTLIYDVELDVLLKDLGAPGMKVCICRGGRGGKGNKAFATSTRQTPRFAQDGKPGQERNLRLELKLIADVGLVGMPNAGKSTLISRCSAARPRIADYPFTTLEPVLGIVELSGYRRFVMADIPGLIEGAHAGAGLGHEFLRHIERTRVIVHILDIMPADGSDPVENYAKIRDELDFYSHVLTAKPELVVLNKVDLDNDGTVAGVIAERLKKRCPVLFSPIPISAVTGAGVTELKEVLWKMVKGKAR